MNGSKIAAVVTLTMGLVGMWMLVSLAMSTGLL